MKKHAGAAAAAAVLAAALFLAGCDSFSIPDRLSLPGTGADQRGGDGETPEELALTLDKETTLRGGTVGLFPSGGTEPYSFTVVGDDLYDGTASESVGSVSISELNFEAGQAIGRIKITVADAGGSRANAYVTVVPPAPTLTVEQQGLGGDFKFDWTYADTTIIDNFRLQYSKNGGAFLLISSISKGLRTFDVNGLEVPNHYTFRIYAVSGSYLSQPYDIEW